MESIQRFYQEGWEMVIKPRNTDYQEFDLGGRTYETAQGVIVYRNDFSVFNPRGYVAVLIDKTSAGSKFIFSKCTSTNRMVFQSQLSSLPTQPLRKPSGRHTNAAEPSGRGNCSLRV